MTPLPDYHDVDRARFEAEIVPAGRPAVLRGLVADWPIVRAANQGPGALASWLRGHATTATGEAWFGPPEIGGRFGFTDDFRGYNHDRKLATIDQLLDLILRQQGTAEPWSIYAGALPIARHLPGFLVENPMPLLEAGREMLVSLWLGNRTKTAAHWDLPQNLACVVAGRRRFTLFPISEVDNLYVGPLDLTLAGQSSSLVDVEAPDLDRFPRFADAEAAGETAVLEPGDVLYMPSLWWHAVTGLDEVGAMVNFWWRDGPAAVEVSPLLSLMHAAMTLNAMPAAERERWRALFDHYLFGDDPLRHVPNEVRGLLGGNSDAASRFRQRLKATL